MDVTLKDGKYVVAVSGGVDSVVLLDVLSKIPNLQLIVAHFDHGMREGSVEDRKFVANLARKYRLPFEFGEGKLGPDASEEIARKVRYLFLYDTREKYGAKAVITAHHQDDAIETVILNLLRGTGRKGLSSLQNKGTLLRPLLDWTKEDIKAYAKKQKLSWREDPTNVDTRFTRNNIRHNIMPKLSVAQRKKFVDLIKRAGDTNQEIDQLVMANLPKGDLDRKWFIMLPHAVACETIATWLRTQGIRDFDRKIIDRLVRDAKNLQPGRYSTINKNYMLYITKEMFSIRPNKPN